MLKDLELDPISSAKMAALRLDERMNARVANVYKTEVPKAEDLLKKERAAGEKALTDLPMAKKTVVAKAVTETFRMPMAQRSLSAATLRMTRNGIKSEMWRKQFAR